MRLLLQSFTHYYYHYTLPYLLRWLPTLPTTYPRGTLYHATYNWNHQRPSFRYQLLQAHRAMFVYNYVTTSHKSIGFYYMLAGCFFGLIGWTLSQLIRMEVGFCGHVTTRHSRVILEYNAVISSHGIVMLFAFVMPVGFSALGNCLLPLEQGVCELAYPRLNILSFWLFAAGTATYALGALIQIGGLNAGWTFYPPLVTRDADAIQTATDLMILAMHALGLSSAIGGINFLVTMRMYRHVCEDALGTSLYSWSLTITAVLLLAALPMLALAVTGVILDRSALSLVFDGELGGDPLMFQHLFWFFGHPEVYIVMLPIFGIVSVFLAVLGRTCLIGDEGMVYCMMAIGWVGFMVWGHHMFVVGMDVDSRLYFSIATAVIAIPTAVKVFSYTSTYLCARFLHSSVLTLCFLSFLITFILGGISGLLLSSAGLDFIFHDSYFVVGHFHTVLSLATVFGLLLAILGLCHFVLAVALPESQFSTNTLAMLSGALLIFVPMHIDGTKGMTRRVPESPDVFLPTMMLGSWGMFTLILTILWKLRLWCSLSTRVPTTFLR